MYKAACWETGEEGRAGSENTIPLPQNQILKTPYYVKACQRGFRSTVSGGSLSTHIFFAILHHSSQLGFNIGRQMLHSGSQREDLFGGIHPQTKNPACIISTTMISSLRTLPHSSTHTVTADWGSQEQTTALISHREHKPCSSIWTALTVHARSHHQFSPTPVRAHLGFLSWCYLALILSQKRLGK